MFLKPLVRLLFVTSLLCACGPANSGSRERPPNVRAGGIGAYWWLGATAQEQQYLTETLTKHAKILARHLGGIPRAEVRFYKTKQELSRAASLITVGNRPNTYNLTRIRSVLINNGTGEAFLHRGVVHIYAGAKLEGPELAHALLHTVLQDPLVYHVRPNVNGTALNFRGSHADPMWLNLLVDDWLLSLQLAAQR